MKKNKLVNSKNHTDYNNTRYDEMKNLLNKSRMLFEQVEDDDIKLDREKEAIDLKAQQDAEAKKIKANEDRIAKKLDRIAKGLPVEDVKPIPKPKAKKKVVAKKSATL